VRELEKLTQLTSLDLRGNQLTDVTGLEKLTKLETLWLKNNQITDLTPLYGKENLKRVYVEDNPLSLREIKKFKAAYGEGWFSKCECKVIHNATK